MLEIVTIATENALDVLLARMNETGANPVVVGFSNTGIPFLAYGYAPGGDGWDTGVSLDDPHSGEFEYIDLTFTGEGYRSVHRCEECGAFDRLPLLMLNFPVTVIHPESLPTESDSYPAGCENE